MRTAALVLMALTLSAACAAQDPRMASAPDVFVPYPADVTAGRTAFGLLSEDLPQPDNEIGGPGMLRNERLATRLVASLSALDAKGVPGDTDSLIPWLNACFPDSFELDDVGFLRTDGTAAAAEWRLWTADLNGVDPRDYVLYVRGTRGIGDYSLTTVARSPSRVMYQTFRGTLRGMENTLGRVAGLNSARAESLQSRCIWFAHIADLDNDGLQDLLLHNNLVRYSEGSDATESGATVAELCDLPIPYFWTEGQFSFDDMRAADYYEKLKRCLVFVPSEDAKVISASVDRLQEGRLSPDRNEPVPD